MHLYFNNPVALARFAATSFDVKGEAPWPIAALSCLGNAREEFANGREETGVGGGVRAWRAPNGALIYSDYFVKVIQALDGAMGRGFCVAAVQVACHGMVQGVVNEGGFTRTRNTCDAHQKPHRQMEIHIF